jgi:hypothetical protein
LRVITRLVSSLNFCGKTATVATYRWRPGFTTKNDITSTKTQSAEEKPSSSKWRTKRPADELLPLHPLALYRPGRICRLLDIDKATLRRRRQRGLIPPFAVVGGIKGLTGEQLKNFPRAARGGQP